MTQICKIKKYENGKWNFVQIKKKRIYDKDILTVLLL